MYYLYVKAHSVTGLKYLGKTEKDPYRYKGSGLYWLRHLKKHGNDVSTEVIFESENFDIFQTKCLEYSKLYNIVESEEWANLAIETGEDGTAVNKNVKGVPKSKEHKEKLRIARMSQISPMLGRKHSDETKEKMRQKRLGIVPSAETRKKIGLGNKGKIVIHSEETKKKISNTLKNRKIYAPFPICAAFCVWNQSL